MISHAAQRGIARVLLPLGAVATLVLLADAPALAAFGGPTVTVDDSSGSPVSGTVTQNDTLTVHGTAALSGKNVPLSVQSPGSSQSYALSGSPASIDTRCGTWTGSGAKCVPAVNGLYVFSASSGGSSSSANVTLKIPPLAVASFAGAQPSGSVVTFSWDANTEPDLVAYDIRDSSGNDVTPNGLSPESVCTTSGCEVSIDFGPSAFSTTRTFSAFATRRSAPGSSSLLTSAASNPTTVTFPAPPPDPTPAASPAVKAAGSSGGPGGSSTDARGTAGSSTTGGSAASGSAGGSAGPGGAESAKAPAATLKAYLPTQLAGAAPNLPSVQTEVKPLPEGTYQPTLAYPDQTQTQAVKSPEPVAAQGVGHDIATALDKSALWRSLGAAVILLLIAGHLRAWVEQVEQFD